MGKLHVRSQMGGKVNLKLFTPVWRRHNGHGFFFSVSDPRFQELPVNLVFLTSTACSRVTFTGMCCLYGLVETNFNTFLVVNTRSVETTIVQICKFVTYSDGNKSIYRRQINWQPQLSEVMPQCLFRLSEVIPRRWNIIWLWPLTAYIKKEI